MRLLKNPPIKTANMLLYHINKWLGKEVNQNLRMKELKGNTYPLITQEITLLVICYNCKSILTDV